MSQENILVIDAGTTGIRALIYDRDATILATAYTDFPVYHPSQDRVEQDALEIWEAGLAMVKKALADADIQPGEITALGITNQRATTVIWDRETGEPVSPAIVWQDTRTSDRAAELLPEWGEKAYSHTGWSLAPIYSSLSIEWIFDNVEGTREAAREGRLAFGTIDSWLIYKLTGGKVHAIGASNATVAGCYDLIADEWYEEFLTALDIPMSIFPDVKDDSGLFGHTDQDVLGAEIPIGSAIADQHSALFAQGCIEPGTVKCTHGTGTFLDMTVGDKPVIDTASGLTCQIAWRMNGRTTYVIEGYAGTTGAAVQWLRDGAGLISTSAESEEVARSVPDTGGVYFVPALTGLSAPYWDPYARGAILGITPGTTRGHLVRATLEGIVFSVRDFMDVMSEMSGYPITKIAVDGGGARNNLLLQMQADQLGATVTRPANTEATSLGAAFMAGLATGVWASVDEVLDLVALDATFEPQISDEERDAAYSVWKRAVERSQGWARK